jgi:hypothetical protein
VRRRNAVAITEPERDFLRAVAELAREREIVPTRAIWLFGVMTQPFAEYVGGTSKLAVGNARLELLAQFAHGAAMASIAASE